MCYLICGCISWTLGLREGYSCPLTTTCWSPGSDNGEGCRSDLADPTVLRKSTGNIWHLGTSPVRSCSHEVVSACRGGNPRTCWCRGQRAGEAEERVLLDLSGLWDPLRSWSVPASQTYCGFYGSWGKNSGVEGVWWSHTEWLLHGFEAFLSTIWCIRMGKQCTTNIVHCGDSVLLITTPDIMDWWSEYYESLFNSPGTPYFVEAECGKLGVTLQSMVLLSLRWLKSSSARHQIQPFSFWLWNTWPALCPQQDHGAFWCTLLGP